MSRGAILKDLFHAVHLGHSEEITKLVNSYGPSDFAAWSKGYLLILRAMKNRNTEIVELLLKNNCEVNSTVPNRVSPLHVAVCMGEIKIVEMLLNRQAEINARDENQRTPLLVAITSGIKKYEIIHDDLIDLRRQCEITIAQEKRRVEIIKLLVERGADVNIRDQNNVLPLQVAIINHEVEIIKLLLHHNANPNVRDKQNRSLLRRALNPRLLSNEHRRLVVELLLNHGSDPNISEMDGQSALHTAVSIIDLDNVETLLVHKADVNARDREVRTPLHRAVLNIFKKYPPTSICDMLLKYGALPDVRDSNGDTPLHLCMSQYRQYNSNNPQHYRAYFQVVKNLVTHGAGINSASFHHYGGKGFTPLQLATDQNCQAEMIEFLLSMGAEVNPKTSYQSTPLYHAARHGNGPSAKILVDHGAMTNPKGRKGKSIVQIAVDSKSPETVEQILRCCCADNANNMPRVVMKGDRLESESLNRHLRSWFKERDGKKDDITSEQYKIILNNFIEDAYAKDAKCGSHCESDTREDRIVKLLVSKGVGIDFDSDGKTSLMYAIKYGDVEMTKLCLLDHTSVDPEILNLAVAMGRLKIVDILLKYDRRNVINAFDSGGRQALHYAAMDKRDLPFSIDPEISIDNNAKDNIAKLLVHSGASVINRSEEMSPLVIAARNNRVKLVKFLIANDAEFSRRDFKTIHAAAKNNAADVVKLLLRYGVDINVKNRQGKTAFYIVSKEGPAEMVKFLLDLGAYMGFDRNAYWRYGRNTGGNSEEFFRTFFVEWSTSPDVREVIQRHILQIIGSGERLDRGDLRQIDKDTWNEELIGFVEKCQLEIAKMMGEQIGDSKVCFYDIFEKGIDQLTMYARNDSIVHAWKSKDLAKEFPIHYNVININFSKALTRVSLLYSAAKVFYSISGYEFMPELIMNHVFSYLNDADLKSVIAAGSCAERLYTAQEGN